MPSDINELDVTDAGLKGIFGERFHDETESKPVAEESNKVSTNTTNERKTEQKGKEKPEMNWMDYLVAFCKRVFLYGALIVVIYYWQHKGLMAESVALPCMLICSALAGWGAARIGVRK